MPPRAFLAIITMMAFAGAASGCEPTTASPEVSADIPVAGTFYVDKDCPSIGGSECISVWIYQESNGILGLQRNDDVHDNTCGGQIDHDTVVLP